MASVVTSLDTVVQDYLNDVSFQQERDLIAKQRDGTIPHYQHSMTQFANGTFNLEALSNALKTLHKDTFWGLHGAGLSMGIYTLLLHHLPGNSELETHLRFIITGLNAQNVGQRIEQFYNLLEKEKQRLGPEKIKKNEFVSPRKSALIVSVFAFWNDYAHTPYIYYPFVRLGLAALINARLIPAPSDISIDNQGVKIISEADHLAVSLALDNLGGAFPQLKRNSYWAESFFIWLVKTIKQKPNYLKDVIILDISGGDSEDTGVDGVVDKAETPGEPVYIKIDDDPLMPVPEPLLTQLIGELRKHILVEESVVRRIYQNLLNGHVIFTGPPGTGKTELARLIPEILWQREEAAPSADITEEANAEEKQLDVQRITHTAYTATLVTATNEWSARTLISSIAPMVNADKVSYRTQHGHLTAAILRNWAFTINGPAQWEFHGRKRVQGQSSLEDRAEREYQGHWLIIDEFNRAPIDTALGEALTTLSDGEALLVPIDGTYVKVPLPRDFRIIGTLNSFDRNYLNKLSEALKRRFAFIEILPPTRARREAEQKIVLYKALKKIAHLSNEIRTDEKGRWLDFGNVTGVVIDEANEVNVEEGVVSIKLRGEAAYDVAWNKKHPFYTIFNDVLWPLFEVIRIYRQLGTAQAIRLVSQVVTTGLLQNVTTEEQWLEALDAAFCDTIADQLQVLLPDELEILSWVLKYDAAAFREKYNGFLANLAGKQRRYGAHLETLSALVNKDGKALLTDEEVEQLLENPMLQLPPEVLDEAFHLEHAPYRLPQLGRRLRAFKAERGL